MQLDDTDSTSTVSTLTTTGSSHVPVATRAQKSLHTTVMRCCQQPAPVAAAAEQVITDAEHPGIHFFVQDQLVQHKLKKFQLHTSELRSSVAAAYAALPLEVKELVDLDEAKCVFWT